MKTVGNVLEGIGFMGMLLFASGADLNEVAVTIGGMMAGALLMSAGMAFEKAARIRQRRLKAKRQTFAAAGVAAVMAAVLIGSNMISSFPAAAAVAEEPVMIEIHSEYDVIEIDEAPPIQAEQEIFEAPTAAATIQTAETPAEEPETAAGFVYLAEIPLSYDQQYKLYSLWTGAGYDYITALALADAETGGTFSTSAINHDTHDYGMFQLNKASWAGTFKREFGISSWEDMMDYELNIRGAIYVYGDCVDRYGETERAIVAYNMGYAKYDSTKYSRKVLSNYEKWQAAYNEVKHL